MLVLSRQRDETIMIGDEIEVTIVDVRGDKVRLGITAPTKVAVHRKEIYEAIKRENEQAASLAKGTRGATAPMPAELQALRTNGLPKRPGIRGPVLAGLSRLGTSLAPSERASERASETPENRGTEISGARTAFSHESGPKSG
jgi:carbon storage regulator